MTLAAEDKMTHLGESCGAADHDHDLIHEPSRRLDSLWRYDQYISNAEWRDSLRQFWCDVKQPELHNINRLKELIAKEVESGCFWPSPPEAAAALTTTFSNRHGVIVC